MASQNPTRRGTDVQKTAHGPPSGTHRTWLGFADRIIPPRDPIDGDQLRRTRLAVLLVATVSSTVGTLGLVTLALGLPAGFIMLGVAFAFLGALIVLRVTRSLAAFGNLTAALWVAGPLTAVFQWGTIVCPEAMVLGLASIYAIMFGGGRWGGVWLTIEVVALGAASVILEPPATRAAAVGPIAFALVVFAISTAFEWTREAAIVELRSSETSRRRAEQEVALMRADRMASLGQLAAGVAHEINNPLSYVIANFDFLRSELARGKEPDEDWVDAIEESIEGAERIRHIVRELKAFTRVDATQQTATVSLTNVIERSIKFAKPELRHRAKVKTAFEDEAWVEADALRLSQVFVNLLVNAAHALKVTGSAIEVGLQIEGDHAVAFVRDDGPGIPSDVLERVFDPFFTTKPVGEGTGLGLPVSKGIIESMGGELRIESEVGGGTTVLVELPAVDAPVDAGADAKAELASTPRRRLLVIDDDELVLRSVRRLLHDHDVTCVSEPEVGLRKLIASPEDWDIILCDITMPGLSGIELYRQLVEEAPRVASRVVFITGGVFTDEARDFIRAHPSRVLDKPLGRDALLPVLERSCEVVES